MRLVSIPLLAAWAASQCTTAYRLVAWLLGLCRLTRIAGLHNGSQPPVFNVAAVVTLEPAHVGHALSGMHFGPGAWALTGGQQPRIGDSCVRCHASRRLHVVYHIEAQ